MPNANDFRHLFVPGDGKVLVVGDFTQIEVRVFGLLANEPVIAGFFESGYDLHRASASLLFKAAYEDVTKSQRKAAKSITFGILYGMGVAALAEQLGCDVPEAQGYLDAWDETFPAGSAWRKSEAKASMERGYILMADGRRVATTSETRPSQCYNYPVQGSAASCQYVALRWLYDALGASLLDADILAVVHDEMIVECAPEDAETVSALFHEAMAEGVRQVFPGASVANLCSIVSGADWSEKE